MDELALLKERCERLELLYQVSNVIHSTLEPEQALQLILSEAVRLTRASSGSVVLINPTTGFLEILAAQNLPAHATDLKLRVGEGITGWVAQTGKPARVSDVASDSRYVMVKKGTRSELAVPLEALGTVRGVINVDSALADAFRASDQELLEALARPASQVIQNSWLYQQQRLKVRLFETLVSIGQTINSTVSLDDALNVITREACLLMEAKMGSLLLMDSRREWLDLRASYGAGEDYIKKPRLSMAESLVGIVARRKKPLQVENVQTSSRYQNVEIAKREGLLSLLSVPLVFSGAAIGVLNVYKGHLHSFSNEEIRTLSALADLSALAIEKAKLYERIVEVEEQLRQSEKLSALGLLAAEVAHEIRNPLTVMNMLYHSLDLRYAADDARARDAEIISEKMVHLNKIVEQILGFTRGAEPLMSPLNANELLNDLGVLLRHKLRQQNISFEPRLAADLPMVKADPTQLEQAFLNLALNAVEAMPNGGQLRITTRAIRLRRQAPGPTHILVEFRDTGEGMNSETRRRAFGSLLSTTKPRGTGLGLAIVSRVVGAHRGKLKIWSRLNQGTSINLILPV